VLAAAGVTGSRRWDEIGGEGNRVALDLPLLDMARARELPRHGRRARTQVDRKYASACRSMFALLRIALSRRSHVPFAARGIL
jgi:hypothetical protein